MSRNHKPKCTDSWKRSCLRCNRKHKTDQKPLSVGMAAAEAHGYIQSMKPGAYYLVS